MITVNHTSGNCQTPSIQGGFEAIQGNRKPFSTIYNIRKLALLQGVVGRD